MRQILAIGGGGFMMESTPSPVDRLIRDLTAKTQPAVCFLATPSGDLPAHIDRFHETYGALGCDTSHLAFFRQPDSLVPHADVAHLQASFLRCRSRDGSDGRDANRRSLLLQRDTENLGALENKTKCILACQEKPVKTVQVS